MNKLLTLPLSILAATLAHSSANAQKFPMEVAELNERAHAIVIANIQEIQINKSPVRFGRGFGDSNWIISVSLLVEQIEKGNIPGRELEVRCFRIRKRKSFFGYMTPSGHHPIPASGTRVRAYLRRQGSEWHVLSPNGFTPTGEGKGRLGDAPEILELRDPRGTYTFLLPIEYWILGLVVVIPVLLVILWRRRRRRKRAASA